MRCIAVPLAIATTSSGATRRSTARIRSGVCGGAKRRRCEQCCEAVYPAALCDVSPSHSRSQLRVLGRPDVLRRESDREYAAAQSAAAVNSVAKLFTLPPYAMYRRPTRDRNYEFWGDQTFYGENPIGSMRRRKAPPL